MSMPQQSWRTLQRAQSGLCILTMASILQSSCLNVIGIRCKKQPNSNDERHQRKESRNDWAEQISQGQPPNLSMCEAVDHSRTGTADVDIGSDPFQLVMPCLVKQVTDGNDARRLCAEVDG